MLKNLKFVWKIVSMPLVATLGFLLIFIMFMFVGSKMSHDFRNIQEGYVPALELYMNLGFEIENVKRSLEDAVSAADPELFNESDAHHDTFLAKLQLLSKNPIVDKKQVDGLIEGFEGYYAIARETAGQMISGEMGDDFMASVKQMQDMHLQLRDSLEQLTDQAKKELNDAFNSAERTQTFASVFMIIAILVALFLLGAISYIVTRYLTKSLKTTMAIANRMAEGDLTQRLELSYTDELGETMQALDRLFVTMRDVIETIGDNSLLLASSSEQLSTLSREMSANAEETSTQAKVASVSAEQVNSNIQNVAVAVEQLTASVREIASNANEAARIANSAVAVAEATNSTIATLGTSSVEIGNVINVITSIAEQTNLLALNATIEAARAGEAGKGFGVVANEVKELAKETAKATEDIREKINAIQNDSTRAVDAITEISSIIEKINGIQTTIATAVEEQTATAAEIGRNVAAAASGSSEIAGSIGSVADAAESTSAGASSTLAAAAELAEMAAQLRNTINRFSYQK